jgi:hypothetical protein
MGMFDLLFEILFSDLRINGTLSPEFRQVRVIFGESRQALWTGLRPRRSPAFLPFPALV